MNNNIQYMVTDDIKYANRWYKNKLMVDIKFGN